MIKKIKKKTKKAPLGFTDPWSASAAQAAPPTARHSHESLTAKKPAREKFLWQQRQSFNWDQVPGCPSLLGLGAGFRSVTHLLCPRPVVALLSES